MRKVRKKLSKVENVRIVIGFNLSDKKWFRVVLVKHKSNKILWREYKS